MYAEPGQSQWWNTGLIIFLFASLWTLTLSTSINMQKHTWPMSSHLDPYIYIYLDLQEHASRNVYVPWATNHTNCVLLLSFRPQWHIFMLKYKINLSLSAAPAIARFQRKQHSRSPPPLPFCNVEFGLHIPSPLNTQHCDKVLFHTQTKSRVFRGVLRSE